MASRNKQETCHCPDISILLLLFTNTLLARVTGCHFYEAAPLFALSRAVSTGLTAGWGTQSNMTQFHVRADSSRSIRSNESHPEGWKGRRCCDDSEQQQISCWGSGQSRGCRDDSGNRLKPRNKVLWVSKSTSKTELWLM